jgi:hypothetical protein
MAKRGQNDVYQTHVEPYLHQIKEWYKTLTLQQVAKKLGIATSTLCKYKNEYPELAEALTAGRDALVEELRASIKKRALGYDWQEVTQEKALNEDGELVVVKEKTVTKHVPADLGSAHLLLKNLDPDWHDADKTTIKQREKELQIKKQKADAAEW